MKKNENLLKLKRISCEGKEWERRFFILLSASRSGSTYFFFIFFFGEGILHYFLQKFPEKVYFLRKCFDKSKKFLFHFISCKMFFLLIPMKEKKVKKKKNGAFFSQRIYCSFFLIFFFKLCEKVHLSFFWGGGG
jgi:hypothetical protein